MSRAKDNLPSDWPSAALFDGHRTLPLRALGSTISDYSRAVQPHYDTAADEVLSIIASEYDGGLQPEGAARARSRVGAALDKLEAQWRAATAPMYSRTAQLGRDRAAEYTHAPVVEDWSARGAAYGDKAMFYLTTTGGLIADLRMQVNDLLTRATTLDGQRSKLEVVPGVEESVLLAAVQNVFSTNEHRIDNWSGKLVELANEVFTGGMSEGASNPGSGGTSPAGEPVAAEEWWVEWVAVGDEKMCPTCAREGAASFRQISELHVVPGGSPECRARCRCVLVWWTRDEVKSGTAVSLSGAAPGNEPL